MIRVIAVSLALVAGTALASDLTEVGETTQNVLAMQAEGTNSVAPRPMLKEVAQRTYERYLKSFTHPIPARFERRNFSGSN